MHFFVINRNERKDGTNGSAARHGKACLRLAGKGLSGIDVHWNFGTARWNEWLSFAAEVRLAQGDCEIVGLRLQLSRLFSVGISFEGGWAHRWLEELTKRSDEKYGSGRTIGLSLHGRTLWVALWYDPMMSKGTDPKWWHMAFDIDRFIKGRAKYSSRVYKSVRTAIPMPEGLYPATIGFTEERWEYPRWFAKVRMGAQIRPDNGIPVPGKGENAYDCDEDAIFCSSSSHTTEYGCIGDMVASVMRDRCKYGNGVNWRPEKATANPSV